MNGQKHIINREVLELTVHDRESALPVQNKASEFIKYKLNPALDTLFSKLSSPDEVVQVNSLVLDLGTVDLNNLDDDFLKLTLKKAENQLTELIFTEKAESENSNSFTSGNEAKKVKVKSLKASYLDQFCHFLETGNLSWWKNDGSENPVHSILDQILLIDKSSLQKQLLPLLKKLNVKKRLVYQFNDSQLEVISKKVFTKGSKNGVDFLREVQRFFIGTKKGSTLFREAFWELVFESISDEKTLTSQTQKITFLKSVLYESLKTENAVSKEKHLTFLFKKLAVELQKEPDKNLQLVAIAILEFSHESGLNLKKFISFTQKLDLKKNQEIEKTHKRLQKKKNVKGSFQKEIESIDNTAKEENEKSELTIKESIEKEETPLQRPKNKILEADEIFISNAGIVLLYPFLKYFFEGLGLLDEELQFKSIDHAIRAVHLLQFIVTKSQVNPEHELSLNKILCGLDISEPIPQGMEITKEEKDECENLLSVVLERWDVLKTKKTEALRENFLKREGILTFENRGWNLKIERNSFDVLLDKLPWGISLIKLPWTEQIIHVEW